MEEEHPNASPDSGLGRVPSVGRRGGRGHTRGRPPAAPAVRGRRRENATDPRLEQLVEAVGRLQETLNRLVQGGAPGLNLPRGQPIGVAGDYVGVNGASVRQEPTLEGTANSGDRTVNTASTGHSMSDGRAQERAAQRNASPRMRNRQGGCLSRDERTIRIENGDLRRHVDHPQAAGPFASITAEEARIVREEIAAWRRERDAAAENAAAARAHVPVVAAEQAVALANPGHPYTTAITSERVPDSFKPPRIGLYDGKTDPDDHLENYVGHMLFYGYSEAIKVKAFRQTLTGAARRWFTTLKPNSISCWNGMTLLWLSPITS